MKPLPVSPLAACLLLAAGACSIAFGQQPPPASPTPAPDAPKAASDPAHPKEPPFAPGGALAWLKSLRKGADGVNSFRLMRAMQQIMIMDRERVEEIFRVMIDLDLKQMRGQDVGGLEAVTGYGTTAAAFRLSQLDPKKAMEIAGKGADPGTQLIILANMAATDLPGALEIAGKLPAKPRESALEAICQGSTLKPRDLFAELEKHPGREYDAARTNALARLAREDPDSALESAKASVNAGQAPEVLAVLMQVNPGLKEKIMTWAEGYSGAQGDKVLATALEGLAWIDSKMTAERLGPLLPKLTADQKPAVMDALADGLIRHKEEDAGAVFSLIGDEKVRSEVVQKSVRTMLTYDPERAYRTVKGLPDGPDKKLLLPEVKKSWGERNPNALRDAEKTDEKTKPKEKGKK